MSDIPDWLNELAADDEHEGPLGGEIPEGEASEEEGDLDIPDTTDAYAPVQAEDPSSPEPVGEAGATDDPMDQLRSEIDAQEEAEETEESGASELSFPALSLESFRLEGLKPVQQFVLAVLLFLDILVIGLLFLIILGRISI